MSRYIGQGHKGEPLKLTLVPSSALKTMIDEAIAANTTVTGWKVAFTKSANWEVSHAAADAFYDAIIEEVEKTNGSPYYYLTCDIVAYKDGSGNIHTPHRLRHEPYQTAPSLGDGLVAYTTSSSKVVGSSAGAGFVVAVDEPSGYCDALF